VTCSPHSLNSSPAHTHTRTPCPFFNQNKYRRRRVSSTEFVCKVYTPVAVFIISCTCTRSEHDVRILYFFRMTSSTMYVCPSLRTSPRHNTGILRCYIKFLSRANIMYADEPDGGEKKIPRNLIRFFLIIIIIVAVDLTLREEFQ